MTDDIPIHLVHALPGRCRLRLESAPAAETWTRLAHVLTGGQGVQEVRASLRTGSLLILFDPEQTSLEMILTPVRNPDWLEQPFPEAAGPSPADTDPGAGEESSGPEPLGRGLIKRLAFPGMVLRRFCPGNGGSSCP
nr:hypothetical protein [Desulfobacula sp.]